MRIARRLIVLVAATATLAAIQAAGAQAYVYWTTGTHVGRSEPDGSGINHTWTAGATNALGVAVDGSHIYWGDGSSVARANLDGSDPQPAWIPSVGGKPVGLATDGTYIYWVTGGSSIHRANLDGTDVTTLVGSAGSQVSSLVVVGGTIYYPSESTIESVPAAGGTPQAFIDLSPIGSASSSPFVGGIAAANGYLYWTELTLQSSDTFGSLGRAPIDNVAQVDETFVSGLIEPAAIATDGTYVYWTDLSGDTNPTEIGRAPIADPSAADHDFISEPDAIQGVAVDAGFDATTTTVSCTPTQLTIGQPSSCTATVADSSSPATPTGTVNFSGNGATFFSGSPCQLVARSTGAAACTVGADLTAAGTQTVTASYNGDPVHHASSAIVSLCAGTAAQCGGKPLPPPPKPKCIVPKLKGKTLAQARAGLRKAHCALGKVTKPSKRHGHKSPRLLVHSTKPAAGAKLSNGAKVAVKLVAAPVKKRKR
jgi:hypothetical protein